jgi:predicted PurR-regulated permease PerM
MHPLVVAVCIVVLLAAAKLAASVLVPLLIAFAIAIAFRPLSMWLGRRAVPAGVATALTALAVLAAVAGAGLLLWQAVAELGSSIPRYQGQISAARDHIATWLGAHGVGGAARALRNFDPGVPIGSFMSAALGAAPQLLEALLVVLLVTAFIQLESKGYRTKLIHVLGGARPVYESMATLRDVQTYLKIKALTNLAGAVVAGFAIWAFGVSNPLLWGVAAFVFGFVPMVGGFLAGIPPIALAFAEQGVGAGVGLAAAYGAIYFLIHNVMEPKWMGRAVGLSPLLIIVSMLVWGFVFGATGALLAVPLTMAVKAGLARVPGLEGLVALMEDSCSPARSMTPGPSLPTEAARPV